MKKIITMLVTAATLAGVGIGIGAGCSSEKRSGDDDSLELGAPMPQFSVTGPTGTVTDGDLAGVRSVVVFFRTTCPDCSREMPNVDAAFKRVADSEVRFVAVSKEENAEVAVPEYWEAAGMTMPYRFDPSGAMFEAFGIRRVPTLYLFGTDGKLAYAAVETFDFSADELVDLIEDLK